MYKVFSVLVLSTALSTSVAANNDASDDYSENQDQESIFSKIFNSKVSSACRDFPYCDGNDEYEIEDAPDMTPIIYKESNDSNDDKSQE